MPSSTLQQRRVFEIGTEILERARRAEPQIYRPDWWINRLLDWSTAEPARKVQLFRFVDVLPSLRTDEEVVRHLAEYLLADHVPLPRPFAGMLKSAAKGAWFAGQLASAARSQSLRMARRFIAGENSEEALETILSLRRRRMGFTIDILGEATTSDAQADWYAGQCCRLLEDLSAAAKAWEPILQVDHDAAGPMPRVNLSVKLTSLEPNFDPASPERSIDAVGERLRPILRLARRVGAFVNVDMEQYRYKDLTLAAFRRILMEPEFRDVPHVGIVLQAYLKDSPADLDAMLEWVRERGTPIAIRLVKGAYWDVETVHAIASNWPIPVFTRKWESDAQYEAMARTLLDHHGLVRPALASHNVRSLAAAMAYAEAAGVDTRAYEIQMLFGMGDPLKTAVADMGYTLRIYTPFGELIPGMAYLIRRLLENTSNESFLKHTFSEHEAAEHLLADPAEARPASPPLARPVAVDPEEIDVMNEFEMEPNADFSRADARKAMSDALGAVREDFGKTYPLIIDGMSLETAETFESVNPSETREVVGRVSMASVEQADHAVAAARRAFEEQWSGTTATDRAGLLRRAADIMHRRRCELSAWIVYETGKPWREADADVCEAIDFCRYYAMEMERLEGRPRRRDVPGQENLYVYRPRGVAVVIAPWNFPLAILTGMTSAALAAVNTVIMKPAGQSPVIAAKLMEVFAEAGFPSGIVHYLPGAGRAIGAHLVEHADVNLIAFTGSRQVGVSIYERAAKWRPGQKGLKRVIAEMGGKNAVIVDADADLDEAVAGVVASAFGYAGQKCSACSRVIVDRRVRDAFVTRFVEATKSVPIGPADEPETVLGPVIDEASREKIRRYIEQGKKEAKLVYEGGVGELAKRGTFVGPAIFDDVPPDASIAQEEIFGPVVAVIAAEGFEQAIDIANGTDYALTGGLYSRSPAHIEQAKRRFQVGNLYINQKITGALVDRQPFGGFKMSGVGSKAGGPDYLIQFMEPRTITENTLRHGFVPDLPQGG